MAEQIDLPFELWIRVGRRSITSIVYARLRQYALIGGHIGATWRIRLNRPSAAAMRSYVKLFSPLVRALVIMWYTKHKKIEIKKNKIRNNSSYENSP